MVDAKKPRVRKTETVKERVAKQSKKATTESKRSRKSDTAVKVAKKASKPFRFLGWPFRLKPVRFVFRVIGRIIFPRYFRNSFKELRQVTWPSRKETWKSTFAVLIFAVGFGAFITITDIVFDKIIRRIVLR